GAQAKIDAAYATFAAGLTPTVELRQAVDTHVQDIQDALRPWRAGYDYYNFVETPSEAINVLPASSYLRLREIKARYDPAHTITPAQPVDRRGRGDDDAPGWERGADGGIGVAGGGGSFYRRRPPGVAAGPVRSDRGDPGALAGVPLCSLPAERIDLAPG